MSAGRLPQAAVRALDWIAAKTLPPDQTAGHLRTGRRGEEEAYFYLRRRGYTIIARNFRSPHHRGKLDLVGWDGEVLCIIEAKNANDARRETRRGSCRSGQTTAFSAGGTRLQAPDAFLHMAFRRARHIL
jgi:hypothetical protein